MTLHWRNDSPDTHAVCIYKVLEKLLKGNEDAYTPRIVSIGPFHHGKPHLQAMERYKYRRLKRFLEREARSPITLYELVRLAEDMERGVRECYNDTSDHLTLLDFSKMIMLDGIFIVELLLENFKEAHQDENERGLMYELRFMKNDILHDLLLLENQLPLFVLNNFCSFLKDLKDDASIINLLTSQEYFKIVGTPVSITDLLAHDYFKIVGILYTFGSSRLRSNHLLKILRNNHGCIPHRDDNRWGRMPLRIHSATELQGAAGDKFIVKRPTDGSLVHIVFDSSKGILHIPQVTVN